jgi:excisionase family DNA binding protein
VRQVHYGRLVWETLWMDERWLSVEEIAEYLGVSKDTVYAWVSCKRIPGHRVGRFWKFKTAEVDEWVRAGGAAAAAGSEREEGEPS